MKESDIVTWKRVEELSNILWQNLEKKNNINFHSVSTISRGGLVPARIIADILGIDEILVDKNQIPIDSIFVDDIYDSGNTFKKIISKGRKSKILSICNTFCTKRKTIPKTAYFCYSNKRSRVCCFSLGKI